MPHGTHPGFRSLGRFAPVAVNSGLRPETCDLTTTVAADGLDEKLKTVETSHQAQAVELAQLRERLAAAVAESSRFQQDAEGLRSELVQHKQQSQAVMLERDQLRSELAALKVKMDAAEQLHQEHRQRSAQEIQQNSERLIKVERKREEARQVAGAAREEAATLRG